MIHATITVKGGGGRVIRDWAGTVEELAQLEPTLEALGGLPFASRLTVTLKPEGKTETTTTLLPGEGVPGLLKSSMLTGEPKLDEPQRPPLTTPMGAPLPPDTKLKKWDPSRGGPNPTTVGSIPGGNRSTLKKWEWDPTPSPVFPPYLTTDQIITYAGTVEQYLSRLEPGFRWEVSRPIRASTENHLLTAKASTGKGEVVCAVRVPSMLPRDMSAFEGIAMSEAVRITQMIRGYLASCGPRR